MTSFAVVIPLYNKGPHVARALDSVLRQTRPPEEIIVVDDNSTDDGVAVVAGYQDPRIRVLRRTQPGPGGYAARNLAINEAKSEWIAFLDADDAWSPNHLAVVAETITAVDAEPNDVPLACVFSGFEVVEPSGARRSDRFSRVRGRGAVAVLDFSAVLDTWLELGDCPIWTSASAFPRARLIEAGLFPAERCVRGGDKDLWLRVAALGRTAACPAVTAIYYRDATNMVTRTQSTNARHCMCETIVAMIARHHDRLPRLLKRLFNQEVFNYSVYATRSSDIDRSIWRGFYGREDPMKLATLALLSIPGVPALARHGRRALVRLGLLQ
jgi:glycosyltransferase involved in cell wall biosynthesis